MASDGCIEVAWKGKAFSYLLHHSGFVQTENYGSKRAEHNEHASSTPQQGLSDTQTKAGTGTWQGPAPRGYATSKQQKAEDLSKAAANEPAEARLANGALVPYVGLRTAGIKDKELIKAALEIGYRHFDVAPASEQVVGDGLEAFIAAGRRAELFLGATIRATEFRPEDVRASALASLAALRLESLDLLLLQLPVALKRGGGLEDSATPDVDVDVDVRGAWQALEQLVAEGKVKSLGVANFSLKQLEDLLAVASVKPVVNEIELHPLLAQRKLVGVSFRKGVQTVAHTPLGGGAAELLSAPEVLAVAQETGKTPAQVLLRWNVQRGSPVIPGAASAVHLAENWEGARGWKLDYAQKTRLDTLDAGRRFFAPPGIDWGNAEEGGVLKPSVVLVK